MNQNTPKYQNEKWLKEQYLTLNRKVVDIAKECGVNRITIGRWRKRFEIPSRKFSAKTINKMSRERKGRNTNENNHNWKGDNVSYTNLHVWVRKRKPQPENCGNCGSKKEYLELANISGEYKRDINDYIYLCVRCHKEFDGTLQSFVEGGKKTRFIKNHKPWNKDIPSELQPRFGKKNSQESIEKMKIAMKESWRKRKTSNEVESTQKTIEVYSD